MSATGEGPATARVSPDLYAEEFDRIVLTGEGKIVAREALFDPMEMLPAIIRSPRTWPRMVRLLRRAG